MKKDRKSRDKPKCLWSPNVRPKRQEYTFSGEKIVSSIGGAGETGQLHVKE